MSIEGSAAAVYSGRLTGISGVKLHYDPISTTSRPVLLFLAEHDLPVELVLVDILAGETRTEAFLALNPNAAVPVLQDDGLVLPEGSAILKYLADVAGSPAYPAERKARARVNAAMDWFNTGLSKDLNGDYVYPRMLPDYALPAPIQAEVSRRGLERAHHWLGVLDRHMLAPGGYVCGPDLTIADYLGAVYVGLSEAIEFDLSPWPNVAAWMNRMRARPAWEATHAAFYGFIASRRQFAQAG